MATQLWEIEKSPDGTFDILLNGRPEVLGLSAESTRWYFQSRGIELDGVEGSEQLDS